MAAKVIERDRHVANDAEIRGAAFGLAGCGGGGSDDKGTGGAATVGVNGGMVTSSDGGVRTNVPAGAMESDVTIRID